MELRPHQQKALDNVNEIFAQDNKAIVVHPTGTGKTYIALELFRQNKDKKMVFVSPSSAIIGQLKVSIAKEFGVKPEEYKKVFPNLEITTYQQINSDFKKSETYAQDFDADLVVFDEAHHTAATEWGKNAKALMNSHPETNFLGLTATPQRPDGIDVVKEVFDGNLADEITLEEAVASGLLKMPNYVTSLYSYEPIIEELEAGLEAIKDKYPEKYLMLKKDMEIAKNMLEKSHGLPEIFAKHMVKKDGKYIVFCKDINHLERMVEAAKTQGWFDGVNENVEILAIHSEEDEKVNAKVLKRFRENHVATDNTLRILFAVEKINEGLHLDDIAGEIMLRPTRSKIVYRQQLGRAMSISASTKKGRAVVFDIVDNIDSFDDVKDFIDGVRELGGGHLDGEDPFDDFYLADETRDAREILRKIAGGLEVEWEEFYKRSVKWREEHNGNAPKSSLKDKEENTVYAWERYQILNYLRDCQDLEEQEIPGQYREKVRKLKELGLEYVPVNYKSLEERFALWREWTLKHKKVPSKNSEDKTEKKIANGMHSVQSTIKQAPEKYSDILEEYEDLRFQYGQLKSEETFEIWKKWTLEHKEIPSPSSEDNTEKVIAERMSFAFYRMKEKEKYKAILEEYEYLRYQYPRISVLLEQYKKYFSVWKAWTLKHKKTPNQKSINETEANVAYNMLKAKNIIERSPEKYKDIKFIVEEYYALLEQYSSQKDNKTPEEHFEIWKAWTLEHKETPSKDSKDETEKKVGRGMSNALVAMKKAKEKYRDILEEYESLRLQYGQLTSEERFEQWKEWTLKNKMVPSQTSADSAERSVAQRIYNALRTFKKEPKKYKAILEEYERLRSQYPRPKLKALQQQKERELAKTRQLKTQAEQAETLDTQTQAALDQVIEEQTQKPKGPGE